jgi:starch synthase
MVEKKKKPASKAGVKSAKPDAAPHSAAKAGGAPVPAAAPGGRAQKPKAAPVRKARSTGAPKAPSARGAAKKTPASKLVARVADRPVDGCLSILMVASEAHPFAKTGGLAEVVGSLPLALARLGHRVTIVLPRYRDVQVGEAPGDPVTLQFGGGTADVTFYRRPIADRVEAVLVDAPALFDREGLYGDGVREYGDNGWRFAVLSRAALEYARRTGERPSIIHAHDWQAGLVPVFQKMLFSSDPVVGDVPVVFTIHNLAFQGLFPREMVQILGLPGDVLHVDAMEFWGQVSYLKAGVNFSERITTVSPTYAREILQPDLSFGFSGVLQRRASDLAGILNGIDTVRWNPEADPFVDAAFSAEALDGKREAKRLALKAAGLPVDEASLARPLLGIITRLTDQKGMDLVAAASDALMALDASWIMLGSGEEHYEGLWRHLARLHPDRVSATIGFDERLAHLIEAGSDMFLMPSRYEPCGLNQMYSLRYGTVPIVRETGGLADTVRDADAHGESGTGFTFTRFEPEALLEAMGRALTAFQDPSRWQHIQQAGMREEHSWDASAREYVKVYEQA